MTLHDPRGPSGRSPLLGAANVVEFARLGSPNSFDTDARQGTWAQFYAGRDTGSYRAYVKDKYKPFLDAIRNEIEVGSVVLEAGCGIGTITRLLTQRSERMPPSVRFMAYDIDQEMVRNARSYLPTGVRVVRGDLRENTWMRCDVLHSHGVLEHFNDYDIYRTLEAQSQCGARVAIHYVPGELHGKPSFGDERLMPLTWWQDKWEPNEAFTFNGGKDYVLIWRF